MQFEFSCSILNDRRDGDWSVCSPSFLLKGERESLRLRECKMVKLENRKREGRKEKARKCGSWRKRAFFILAWRLYGKLDISSRSLVGSAAHVEPLGLGGSRIVRSDLGQTAPKTGTHSTNTNVIWESAWKLALPDLLCARARIYGPLYALCWPLEKLRPKITVEHFWKFRSQ